MKKLPFIHIVGSTDPEEKEGLVAFTVEGVHPHDVAQILSNDGICIRTGHHCGAAAPYISGNQCDLQGKLLFL